MNSSKNQKEAMYMNEDFAGNPPPISETQNKVFMNQLKKSVCKIYEPNGNMGTGFLCKIPYPDQLRLLPVLITNFHVLNKTDLKENDIEITFNNDKIKKILKINKFRKIFTKEDIDVTIIEIIQNLDQIRNLNDFLDIDENIYENN